MSRIDATSELKQLQLTFDINSEIYPLEKGRVGLLDSDLLVRDCEELGSSAGPEVRP